jgi:cytochrome P450
MVRGYPDDGWMPLGDRDDPQAYPFGPNQGLGLHPSYRHVQQHEPLCRVRLPYGEPAWLVTRYDDVKTVLGDPCFSRAEALGHDQPRMIPDLLPLGLLDMDPPKHSRIRRLLAKAFTVRGADRLRPSAQRLATELVTAMIDAGPPADMVGSFAQPLPIGVIYELLGVPGDDRDEFARWVSDATSADVSADTRAEGLRKQADYMADLVARRRREPTDDLLGALVLARDEDDRLTEDELVLLAFGLLAAGFETTANEIANFVYLLLTHPDQFALLRTRPQLLAGAVEELLRFTPLIAQAGFARYATHDIALGGDVVTEGDAVLAFTPAANRDPAVFPDPDSLDLTRPGTGHLTFGHGTHYCVGAQLARMELQIALDELVRRLPGLRLAIDPDEVRWKPSVLVRGPVTLPVTW